uniref:PH01B001G05.12 protein n=1 Tax=Phyllostachys edulis TaxID=38705 RepID=L0P1J4_PHYED|nr:PH01B001G05.12 [Phyllostachys edulis]
MAGEWNEENWFDLVDYADVDMDAGFDYEPSIVLSDGITASGDLSADPGDHATDGVEEGSLSPTIVIPTNGDGYNPEFSFLEGITPSRQMVSLDYSSSRQASSASENHQREGTTTDGENQHSDEREGNPRHTRTPLRQFQGFDVEDLEAIRRKKIAAQKNLPGRIQYQSEEAQELQHINDLLENPTRELARAPGYDLFVEEIAQKLRSTMARLEAPRQHHSGSRSNTTFSTTNRSNNSPRKDRRNDKSHRSPTQRNVLRTSDDQQATRRANFQGTYNCPGKEDDLHRMRQNDHKTLHQFIRRFSQVRNLISEVSNSSIFRAFKQGVRSRRITEDITLNPPATVAELFEMADRYATASEAVEWNNKIDREDNTSREPGEGGKKKDKKAKNSKNKAKDQKPQASGSKEVLAVNDKEPQSSKPYSDRGKGSLAKPVGQVSLPLTFGSPSNFKIEKFSFDVVDFDTAYNAILRRPTLAKFLMATYYGYQCLKMAGLKGVITIHCDKKMAHTYDRRYLEMVGQIPIREESRPSTNKSKPKAAPKPNNQVKERFAPDRRDAIKSELDKLLKAGFIREVDHPEWLPYPVMVRKSNGKWRMCVDFTDLNKACPKDDFPLPRIDQLVDSTVGCEVLSFLDAYSGYHQINMCLDDEEKTTFITPFGIFCYVKMPFGLKNAGASFQRLTQSTFSSQLGRNLEAYVDDLVVKSIKRLNHITDLQETFDNIRKHRLKLNPKKCVFGVSSGKLLGFLVSIRGIETNPEKIQAIVQMRPPTTKKEIQKLTGCMAALSRFIARLGEKGLPFFKLLRKHEGFEWSKEANAVLEDVNRYLTSAPTLVSPRQEETLLIYLVATPQAVSVVLVVERENVQRPVYYAHKIVVPSEFPLGAILQNRETAGRMAKWSVELGEFDLRFVSRTAIKSQILADFVAEWTNPEPVQDPQYDSHDQWTMYFDGSLTLSDSGAGVVLVSPTGKTLKYAIQLNFQATNNVAEYKGLLAGIRAAKALSICRLLMRGDSQLVVNQVGKEYQCSNPTMSRYVSEVRFYWPTVLYDAKELVKKCVQCQFHSRQIHQPAQALQTIPLSWSFATWGLDILGLFPKAPGGFEFLFVAIDTFTKWIEAEPMTRITTEATKRFMMRCGITRFGVPGRIIKDNGKQFSSAKFQEFCDELGTKLCYASVAHPQSNRAAECANDQIIQGIKTRFFDQLVKRSGAWVQELPSVLWAVRMTASRATGETPFFLVFGAEAMLPPELKIRSTRVEAFHDSNQEQLRADDINLLEEKRNQALIRSVVYQQAFRRNYDCKVQPCSLAVGDLVLRLCQSKSNRNKLSPKWEGPYTVVEVTRPGSV